jgi:Polyketide cyclase / dehydrase and lipid transport
MITPDDLRVEETIYVDAAPETVYDRVSDITHMGDISPTCTGGHWDVGATGIAGDWFTGTNRVDDREWQTRSQVVAADHGREFAFVVGGSEGGWVRWGYLLSPRGGGTDVIETWQVVRIVPHMGETDEQLAALRERTSANLRATLDTLRSTFADAAGS